MSKASVLGGMVIGAAITWALMSDIPRHYLERTHADQALQQTPQAQPTATIPPIVPPVPLIPAVPEQPFPESGSTVSYFPPSSPSANLTVVAAKDGTDNCVVKLEDWNDGRPAIELFVRANEQASTSLVPLGEYRVKVACGAKWYGREELFGRGTKSSVSVASLRFWMDGNKLMGNTINLTQQVNGNFKTVAAALNRF